MNKYKICVYAICKNEEKFVNRWVKSMSEADSIVVLDTGSTDNSVALLKENGVIVEEKQIIPWRFDVARNESMELIPKDTDICVCTDLDEIFEEGWREKLEKTWYENTKRVKYRYTWSFNPDGSEGFVFYSDKIHSYGDFKWTHPVHEVLEYLKKVPYEIKIAEGIQLNHYPDKEKSRSSYLPLLEMSVKEDPEDDRNMHYLGREYMYYQRWDDCISTLTKHLNLKTATWKDERCASMRYIANSYLNKNDIYHCTTWLYKAIAEAPYLREPYIDMANLMYISSNPYGVIYFCNEALKITDRPASYISEPTAWGSTPHDLLCIAYSNIGLNDKAIIHCEKALKLSPTDERIKNNLEILKNLS